MKLRINRQDEIHEVRKITLQVDGIELRIYRDEIKGIVINKVAIDDDKEDYISVRPYASNEIVVK